MEHFDNHWSACRLGVDDDPLHRQRVVSEGPRNVCSAHPSRTRHPDGLCLRVFVSCLFSNNLLLRTSTDHHSLYGAYFSIVYNIPVYFQSIKGLSPRDSGIRTIPIILSVCKLLHILRQKQQ